MKRIESSLEGLSDRLEDAVVRGEDWDIGKTLRAIEVQLDRLTEAEQSRAPDRILESSEHELHKEFGELHRAMMHLSRRDRIDPYLLVRGLEALALCGSAQIRALAKGNDLGRAEQRATRQSFALRDLTLNLPEDRLLSIMGGDLDSSSQLAGYFTEIRFRMAAFPSLLNSLQAHGINGSEFVEQLGQEHEEPIRFIPASL